LKNSEIVYSTHIREQEDKPQEVPGFSQESPIYVALEKKGRGGKQVTVISGVDRNQKEVQKELQSLCSTGGTLKESQIELQGDHRQKVIIHLQKKGWRVKQKGG